MRNHEMRQQWSAYYYYYYWHLVYAQLLEKKSKSPSEGTSVIIGIQKLTVHFNGANETSVVIKETTKWRKQNISSFYVHTLDLNIY